MSFAEAGEFDQFGLTPDSRGSVGSTQDVLPGGRAFEAVLPHLLEGMQVESQSLPHVRAYISV